MFLTISAMIEAGSSGFSMNTVLSMLLMLLPAGVIAFELMGKKVPLIILLVPFLITAVFLVGVIRFNNLSIATIAKAIVFGIMFFWLGTLCIKRVIKK